jgi:hypothetical protein
MSRVRLAKKFVRLWESRRSDPYLYPRDRRPAVVRLLFRKVQGRGRGSRLPPPPPPPPSARTPDSPRHPRAAAALDASDVGVGVAAAHCSSLPLASFQLTRTLADPRPGASRRPPSWTDGI